MLPIEEHVDLLPYNTFHIQAYAHYLVRIRSVEGLQELIRTAPGNQPRLILGGGSNLLLTGNFPGLVIKNEIDGITVVHEDEHYVTLKVGAGVNWHQCVMHCVNSNWGGVENLSLIPGTVGAAPMQNIGAYGVEVKEALVSLEAVELSTGIVKTFSNSDCQFGYRESIFKHQLKDQYFISSVTLKLTRKDHHFNISYGALRDVLKQQHGDTVTVKAVSDAVIAIRSSKLPDPAVIGNAGSFFKNPSVTTEIYQALQQKNPSIPSFTGEHGLVKIPAAWLIEQCGWKGKVSGSIGVHKDQALVLVNYGGGSGKDIWRLAMDIRDSVQARFNILLQPEVNLISI